MDKLIDQLEKILQGEPWFVRDRLSNYIDDLKRIREERKEAEKSAAK